MNKQRRERVDRNKKLKEWSKLVRERDNNKCAICPNTKMINAHHIIPKQWKHLMFNLDNGIALCPTHHKYNYTISAHKNPLAFMIWMEKNRPEQSKKVRELYERS